MARSAYVYILTNKRRTVLYVGVTSNLVRRIREHREEVMEGFTKRYRLHTLVYYEAAEDIRVAIAREKQLKGGSRLDKVRLVNEMNPSWRDLYDELISLP